MAASRINGGPSFQDQTVFLFSGPDVLPMSALDRLFVMAEEKEFSETSMIRVAIAEDHAEMRVALRLLLSLAKNMRLICEASNGREAVDCVQRLHPDVLVMDIRMPELNGLDAAKQVLALTPQTRVILISSNRGGYMVRQAVHIGAQGFVPKDHVAEFLRTAIEAVHRGETFFME